MFQENREEFKFDWSHLGDIEVGRPNLGNTTHVAVYRLMQYTLRDAIIKHTDSEMANRVFYDAGLNAGKAFYKNLVGEPKDLNDLVSTLQKLLREMNIGILRIEKANLENLEFVLTVDEDLDCSGLPMIEEAICTYDEGFLAGILETFTNRPFEVKEVDCWCTGDRTCRFTAKAVPR
jgi:predicted hydrocarbon binding protein